MRLGKNGTSMLIYCANLLYMTFMFLCKGARSRLCDNPAPQFNGRFCVGEKQEFTTTCNNFTCPPIKFVLPEHLKLAAENHLNSTYFNMEKDEEDNVELICRSNVTRLFYEEYPKSSLKWIKNGAELLLDAKRMYAERHDVVIRSLQINDTGVYLCQVSSENYAQRFQYNNKLRNVIINQC